MIYAQTWCPGDPCDPCNCRILPTTHYETFRSSTEVDINLGSILLCGSQAFVLPITDHSAPDGLTGQYVTRYFPIGLGFRGALWDGTRYIDNVEQVDFLYLGATIFSCTVRHQFVYSGQGSPTDSTGYYYEYISTDPNPAKAFQVDHAVAQGVVNASGGLYNSIQALFGNYSQANPPNGPIGLKGFIYSGVLDASQNKTLKVLYTFISGASGPSSGFNRVPQAYYGSPALVRMPGQSLPRMRVPLVGVPS